MVAARGAMLFVLLSVLALAALGLLLSVQRMQVVAIPALPKMHAVERHGDTALEIRKCLRDKGALQIWRLKNGRFAQVCEYEPGKYGIQIVEKVRGVWEEVTAFRPYDGSWEKVLKYLLRKGELWQGPLP